MDNRQCGVYNVSLDSITIMALITRHIRSYLLLIQLNASTLSFTLDNILDASQSYAMEYTSETLPAETSQHHHSIEQLFHWIQKKGKISRVNDNGELILAQYLGKKPKMEKFILPRKSISSLEANSAATASKLVEINKIVAEQVELLKKQLDSQQSQLERQQLQINKLNLIVAGLQEQNRKLTKKNLKHQAKEHDISARDIFKLQIKKHPHSDEDHPNKRENCIQIENTRRINGIGHNGVTQKMNHGLTQKMNHGLTQKMNLMQSHRNGILKNEMISRPIELPSSQSESSSDEQIVKPLSKLETKRNKQVRKQQKYEQLQFKIDAGCPNLPRFAINSNLIQKVKSTNEYLINSMNAIPAGFVSIKIKVQNTKYGDIKFGLISIPQDAANFKIPSHIQASPEPYLYFDGYAGKIVLDGQEIADEEANPAAIQSGRVLEMRIGDQQVEWLLEGRTLAQIQAKTEGMHPFIELYDKGDIIKIE